MAELSAATGETNNTSELASTVDRLLDPQHLEHVRVALSGQAADVTSENRYVADQLLGVMETSPEALALRTSDMSVPDLMHGIKVTPSLTERHVLPIRDLEEDVDWAHRIYIQRFGDDSPLELPLANFVAAYGLIAWDTGRGADVDKVEESTGITRSSAETIADYGSRTTEAPPIQSVIGYIQPNGNVIFGTAQGTHRTAAAIARGDETIKTNNLTLVRVKHDHLPANAFTQQ